MPLTYEEYIQELGQLDETEIQQRLGRMSPESRSRVISDLQAQPQGGGWLQTVMDTPVIGNIVESA